MKKKKKKKKRRRRAGVRDAPRLVVAHKQRKYRGGGSSGRAEGMAAAGNGGMA